MNQLNAFAHRRSVPVRAPDPRRPDIQYSNFEIDWKRNYPNQRIPLEQYFANIPIPGHEEVGLTYYRAAEQVITFSEAVLHTRIPQRVMDNDICGAGLGAYESSFHNGAIVCCLHGVCYGWRKMYGNHNSSLDVIVQRLDAKPDGQSKEQELEYLDHFVLKVLEYVLKFVVPSDITTVTADSLMKANVEHIRTHQKKKKGRCACPIWTEQFALTTRIRAADTKICKGHYWPFVKLFDQVIPNFIGAIHDGTLFLGRSLNPTTGRYEVEDIDVEAEKRDCISNYRMYESR